MSLLVFFAFIGGIVTILSPCILPILPIILSGSVGEGKQKPFGIVIGFILSFTFFTLFLSSLVNVLDVSPDTLRNLSVVILALFGVSLVLPQAQVLIERLFSKFAPNGQKNAARKGFSGGFVIGLSLGLLWTPCVGPILASVISLALTGSVTGSAAVITLAYALGTGLPMLVIMYGGRQLLQRVPWLLQNAGRIQQVFGVIMIITAGLIFFNIDRQFQSYILETFPKYGAGLTQLEDNDMVTQKLEELEPNTSNKANPLFNQQEVVPAPELIQGGEWFNSEPLTLASLKGKVVLLDFMTYSCINCIRTFPYLNEWHTKYKDDGFVILGVHTPEFEFEKDPENVQEALEDFEIEFPVMQDNDFATWRSYGNRYWPRKYLIDHTGNIIYDHIGEGAYDETERRIQEAIRERDQALGQQSQVETDIAEIANAEFPQGQSPETYFGAWRNQLLGNGQALQTGVQTFERPETIAPNTLYLVGEWDIQQEYAVNVSANARIIYAYKAKNVFMVAGAQSPTIMQLTLDGQSIDENALGESGERTSAGTAEIVIANDQLYRLIENTEVGEHVIELEILEPGLEVFTFTFG